MSYNRKPGAHRVHKAEVTPAQQVTATAIISLTVTIDPKVISALGITPAEFAQFEQSLTGRLVVPGMPDYEADRVSNPLFQEFPKIIVYCATFADVRLSLQYAQRYKWWVTSRAGGHSTAGFSVNAGIVIDVTAMRYATVDPKAMTMTVGAGTRLAT